jgi:DNA-binding transcriptional MocR family regulator
VGSQLPSDRSYAGQLGVSRTTVTAAYQELKAWGLVRGYVARGAIVVTDDPDRASTDRSATTQKPGCRRFGVRPGVVPWPDNNRLSTSSAFNPGQRAAPSWTLRSARAVERVIPGACLFCIKANRHISAAAIDTATAVHNAARMPASNG